MKKMTLLITLFLGTLLAVQVQAQSVKIDVQKSTKKDMKVTSHGSYYTEKQGTEGIVYTVTITNHSSGTLSNVTVRWAVLVRSAYYSTSSSRDLSTDPSLRAVTGTRNLNLGMGQHETFDTDPVKLNVTKFNDGYSYHSRTGDQIDGYVVKVMLGEKVLAVEAKPQDAIERLDNIKPTHNKR